MTFSSRKKRGKGESADSEKELKRQTLARNFSIQVIPGKKKKKFWITSRDPRVAHLISEKKRVRLKSYQEKKNFTFKKRHSASGSRS